MPRTGTIESQPRESTVTRRCIVTRESLPTARLIRFAIGPEHQVVPDIRGKLPGRGLWLTARRDIVDRACAANAFAKAARCRADPAVGLSDTVEGLLRDRCLEVIGLARRAGQAVAGFEKVREFVRSGKAAVLLTACDAAPNARAKMEGAARGVVVVDTLRASELGQVFARSGVVHVAIGSHGLAGRLIEEAGRLAGFRMPAGSGKLS
jgi:predicted RNA-binding protein YlxR (DUF448 family)